MTNMNQVKIEKVTLNIGVGQAGESLEKAKNLLEQITKRKAILTKSRNRNPTWKLRKGDNIGCKVTLRGKEAEEIVKKSLEARDLIVLKKSFDKTGNVSFGVPEYIDFPGMKYDPEIGMMGFDVSVTLKKPGLRISKRRIAPKRIPKKQQVGPQEAMAFMQEKFQANVEEEASQGYQY
ncbi:MAG: 50S ribosomal protein L5 [Candidatus Micrarchaeia archaeon]